MSGKKWILGLVAVGLVAAVAVLPLASAQDFRGDLTAASGDAPFGGGVVGSYKIQVNGYMVSIKADITLSASAGYVLEGWLVDMQSGYKLSLGQLKGGFLAFEQNIVNVRTYGVLVITSEPAGDLNPNPDMAVAGARLPAPFGQ